LDDGRLLASVVLREIVVRFLNCLTRLQLVQMRDQQFDVVGRGMVVIHGLAFRQGEMGKVAVVVIHPDDHDRTERFRYFQDFPGKGCFSAGGAAGDSDQGRFHGYIISFRRGKIKKMWSWRE